MTDKRPIIFIDAYATFIRHYTANPYITSTGNHAGGVMGFLKAVQWLAERFVPGEIYVVWEGGGSPRRRAIYSDYKKQKKPLRMNQYFDEEMEISDTYANRNYQIRTLSCLLEQLPVCQLYIPDCEADDVIGYLCKNTMKDEKKIIFTSDRDYYQLVDKNTAICTLNKKSFINRDKVKEELGVYPHNVVLVRALSGDRSDNIDGIRGAGPKTIVKRFPKVGSTDPVLPQDLINESRNHISQGTKVKLYQRIDEGADTLMRNWKLMNLDTTQNMSADQITKLEYAVKTFEPSVDKIGFMRSLVSEGFNTSLDANWMFMVLDPLIRRG
jgi:5'-3' exonuclease